MGSVAAINPQLMNWIPSKQHSALPFSGLEGAALAQFTAIAPEISRARMEPLFFEDTDPTHVFIVCSGRVKLFVSARDGKTAILRIAGVGEILGLSAVMSGKPHETSAEAVEPCRLKAIRVKDFLCHLGQYPEAAMEATSCLLHDYQAVLNNICRLALPSTVAGRLAALLLEWLDTHDSKTGNPNRLIVSLTQEEIASMTNTSRETVSRVLHQFQQQKLISIKGASVTILQVQALEELAI
ncbi:MAG TPA: Crp/Fnr family transcriptional regulator [Candidatus Angelobacter sp.]|nr:Crp/Fnr family transcriptional regulator [Candidatus Angelobacter sp.]